MTNLLARMRPRVIDDDRADDDGAEARYDSTDDAPPTPRWSTVSLEAEIASVLDESPLPGEQLAAAFQRKELTLASLFARLTVVEARELHRRLARPIAGDALVVRFERLIPERRARLLAFLEGARRREAMQRARPRIGGLHG